MGREEMDTFLNPIFENEEDRYHDAECELIHSNCNKGFLGHSIYFGALLISSYRLTTDRMSKHAPALLSPDLWDEAQKLKVWRGHIDTDRRRVQMGLAILLGPCRSWNDMRDALPEYIVRMIPTMDHLERTRPEAWTLLGDPMKMTQYEKLRETLAIYRMAELVS